MPQLQRLVSKLKVSIKTIHSVRWLMKHINSFFKNKYDPHQKLQIYIQDLKIDTVIDVGANVGQFGIDLRNAGFNGKIISFEPIKKYYDVLRQTAIKSEPWCAYNLGLGDEVSQRNIFIAGNAGLSSSFLQMNDLHSENFPTAAFVSQEETSISTLDIQLKNLAIMPRGILLKIDTQGFESKVLEGGKNILSDIPLCFIELSLSPLYDGEKSYLEILNSLSSFGHDVVDVFRATQTKNRNLLQIEVITKNRKF